MDNFVWLEEVEGKKAVDWVESKNKSTETWAQAHKDFDPLRKSLEEILTDKDRLVLPTLKNGFCYNFWTDEKNIKGRLRRCSVQSFLDKKPQWETLLDVDELAKKDKKDWVFKGSTSFAEKNLALIILSEGGTDSSIIREYDFKKKSFVPNGFDIPASKSTVSWISENEILLGTDFKEEESLTSSGYPCQVKSLKRGQKLEEATLVLQGEHENVGVWNYSLEDEEQSYNIIQKAVSFYEIEYYLYREKGPALKFPLPRSCDLKGVYKGLFLFELEEDWEILNRKFPCGSLISVPIEDLSSDDLVSAIEIVVLPDFMQSIRAVQTTPKGVYISLLNNVNSELWFCSYEEHGWATKIIKTPANGSINYLEADPGENLVLYNFENFIQPQTLYALNEDQSSITIQLSKEYFKTEGMKIYQFRARSEDGTEIPYFLVGKKDVIEKGNAPVLQYGYGGFQIALAPFYSPVLGKAWLEKGGLYVLANIRGGNEFGPKWHSETLKKNRHKRVEDFAAVSKDLIARGISNNKKIAIQGGSNGGLLMGSMYTKFPALLGAIICQVPLLDMLRYTALPPGASWIAEYGDPDDPQMREYLKNNSPYHNVEDNKDYPPIFFHTSSKDDRVHPGHARKMAALLDHKSLENFYFENRVGGHAGSSDHVQRAKVESYLYCFLFEKIMK